MIGLDEQCLFLETTGGILETLSKALISLGFSF